MICALEVISSHGMGSESIAIYSVPAHWAPQVSLVTVFPHTGLPKYRYLQCSRTLGSPSIAIYSVPAHWALQGSLFTVFPRLRTHQPASGQGMICALEVISSRGMGSESIAIYSVPAHWAPQVSLFTVFSRL